MAANQTKLQAELLAKLKVQFLPASTKLKRNPARLIASFLKTAELRHFVLAGKETYIVLHSSLNDRKKVIGLLEIVFNAPSCKTVQAWLEKNQPTAGRPFPLVPSNVEETFFSKEKNKKFIKRKRENFTPLAGAAISGDNFLVRKLLEFVHDNLKYEAGLLLKKTKEREDYLKPYENLEAAMEEFIRQGPILSAKNDEIEVDGLFVRSGLIELDKLELQIGMRQQELPTYVMQEYCDKKPFAPLPKFDKEPKRSCLYPHKVEVDLALIGSEFILHKGKWSWGKNEPCGAFEPGLMTTKECRRDLEAIRHLRKVRSLELDSIIQGLLLYKPKSEETEAQIEVSNEKSRNKVRV